MPDKQKKKAFWRSKTFWFNAISFSVYAATAAADAHPEAKAAKDLAPYVITGGNILLRYITKGPIGIKDDSKKGQ